MIKRITALFLLTLFTGQLTASFLHFDCNMSCCQMDETNCCTVEKAEMVCPTLGDNCNRVVYLPILSGPSAHSELKELKTWAQNVTVELTYHPVVSISLIRSNIQTLAEPPPAFDLPLLI